MCGLCEFSETKASEESEACFVLPLQEAVAHFARRNTRSSTRRQQRCCWVVQLALGLMMAMPLDFTSELRQAWTLGSSRAADGE